MVRTKTQKGTILIVDDTPINTTMLTHILTPNGYTVHSAENGRAALEIVHNVHPDLILLDVMMPIMNGYDTCRRLKADERTRDIPVIFITFLKKLQDKVEGFDAGGIDYIIKPFQQGEVLARVNVHILNRQLQQQLQEESARFQALANATFEGIVIHDAKTILEVNRAMTTMTGYSPEELRGQSPDCYIHPDWRQRATLYMKVADGAVVVLEGRRKNESTFAVEVRMNPIVWQGRSVLVSAVRNISHQVTLEQENLSLRSSLSSRSKFGELIGQSSVMRKIYEQIAQAAACDATVIIYGETGTGKELAARTIFALSTHHTREFVPVNCGAIPENLFESQFFGVQKGAFTGAEQTTVGYFEYADGGTLFLDEVGELPQIMQIKLLRVLEDGTYTLVGTPAVRRADVRIIAATNQHLRTLRESGRIRDDFFHRIHVIALEMPPLRHRKEDLPLLIEHFYQYHADSAMTVRDMPQEILDQLHAYHWPGNVRELFNELRRYAATGNLGLNAKTPAPQQPQASEQIGIDPAGKSFQEIVEGLEQQLLIAALRRHSGNKMQTAKTLRMPLRTLHRKIQKYDIRNR